MHVLIVEDEVRLADHLRRWLEAECYSCIHFQNYSDLETYFNLETFLDPDILILDRLLESKDSCEFLDIIKLHCKKTKIIVLSALGDAKERARIISLGADDYLNKPFEPEELMARIKSLSRRNFDYHKPPPKNDSFDLVVDDTIFDVIAWGAKLNLNKKEFLLAKVLIEHPNKVFSRIKLLDIVWHFQPDIESNIVEATMTHLRRKVEKSGAPVKIKSKRNIGYWLEV